MERKIYHGSEHILPHPSHLFNNTANDYGRGFYCTEDRDLAGEWACRKNTAGFINAYTLDMHDLKVLNLNDDGYTILNWLALLTKYRGYWQRHAISEDAKDYLQAHYLIDISDCDVIIGNRADDSYFSFASDFVAGTISLQKLSEAMRLGKLGEQIVLKSETAFGRLRYAGNEAAAPEIFYQRKRSRDLSARRAYASVKKTDRLAEIYMLDIMRGRVTDDELRLR